MYSSAMAKLDTISALSCSLINQKYSTNGRSSTSGNLFGRNYKLDRRIFDKTKNQLNAIKSKVRGGLDLDFNKWRCVAPTSSLNKKKTSLGVNLI